MLSLTGTLLPHTATLLPATDCFCWAKMELPLPGAESVFWKTPDAQVLVSPRLTHFTDTEESLPLLHSSPRAQAPPWPSDPRAESGKGPCPANFPLGSRDPLPREQGQRPPAWRQPLAPDQGRSKTQVRSLAGRVRKGQDPEAG